MNIELKSDISLKPFIEVMGERTIFVARILVRGDEPMKLTFYLTDETEVKELKSAMSDYNEFLKFSMRSGRSIMNIKNGENTYTFCKDDVYSLYFGRVSNKETFGLED